MSSFLADAPALPSETEARLNAARHFYTGNRLAEVFAILEPLPSEEARNADFLVLLGEAHLRLAGTSEPQTRSSGHGRVVWNSSVTKALGYFSRAKQISPGRLEARLGLMSAAHLSGNHELSRAEEREIQKLFPDLPRNWRGMKLYADPDALKALEVAP